MRRFRAVAGWLVVVGVLLFFSAAPPARSQIAKQQWAQAGSTGGVIGKRGKSASGGEPTAKPAEPVEANKPASPAASRPPPLPRAAPRQASIGGRWFIEANCGARLFEITAELRQTSATGFSGTAFGHTTGGRSRIIDGRLDGNTFTWVRRVRVASLRARGRISGNRIEGSESGPLGNCRFTGTRR